MQKIILQLSNSVVLKQSKALNVFEKGRIVKAVKEIISKNNLPLLVLWKLPNQPMQLTAN